MKCLVIPRDNEVVVRYFICMRRKQDRDALTERGADLNTQHEVSGTEELATYRGVMFYTFIP